MQDLLFLLLEQSSGSGKCRSGFGSKRALLPSNGS